MTSRRFIGSFSRFMKYRVCRLQNVSNCDLSSASVNLPVKHPFLRTTGCSQKWHTRTVGPACAATSPAFTQRSHISAEFLVQRKLSNVAIRPQHVVTTYALPKMSTQYDLRGCWGSVTPTSLSSAMRFRGTRLQHSYSRRSSQGGRGGGGAFAVGCVSSLSRASGPSRSACAGHRHRRRKRQQRPHNTRFRGVSSWTLQLGSLWASKWGVYCRVLIVRLEI
jgi:hypothetical protein